jgi:DNA-binding winged helix-turn-helix (wHTH) protein
MEKKIKALYEFGPFRLDPDERLLLREGRVVPLTLKLSMCCWRSSSNAGGYWRRKID